METINIILALVIFALLGTVGALSYMVARIKYIETIEILCAAIVMKEADREMMGERKD